MDIARKVLEIIAAHVHDQSVQVTERTPLIGDGRVLDSMSLVEVCIALEDFATELGFDFDWTSESAMSQTRSMFKTAGALAESFRAQMGAQV